MIDLVLMLYVPNAIPLLLKMKTKMFVLFVMNLFKMLFV